MALATYTDLQTSIGAFLNRGDLATVIPDFIALFEARARRDLKSWLRFTLTATNVTADYALPATVQEVLSVNWNDGPNGAHNFACRLVTKEEYQGWMETASIGSATAGQMIYVDADIDTPTTTLRFWPPATATGPIANLKIEATKVIPALSASQATNALLREAPDAYLYGSLAESAPYLMHDERVEVWASRAKEALRALRVETDRKLYGGVPRPRSLDRIFG